MSPSPSASFALVVLGGGSAGYAAARTFHALGGGPIAVVDGARELGGLCIRRGCMPSKTLLHAAHVLHEARRGALFGLDIPAARADLARLHARKVDLVEREFAADRVAALDDGRWTLFRTTGRIVAPGLVELADGRRLAAGAILVATGSEVAVPPVPGLDQPGIWTSDEVLDLDHSPGAVVVLGGGVVAVELAQFLARVDVSVTLVQRSPRLLRDQTAEAAAAVAEGLRQDGVRLHLGTALESIRRKGDGRFEVAFTDDTGHRRALLADRVVNALGRRPRTAGLGLPEVGVALDERGAIPADARMRTAVPGIFAAGDCTGPREIVHLAVRQGEIAARTALGLAAEPIDYDRELDVVFTDPAVAFVGLREDELRRRGIAFRRAAYPFADHGKSIVREARRGHVAAWAETDSGRLLAAECVGPEAGELIHVLAVGIALRATAADLLRAPWYHPTLSEIWTYPLEDLAGA